MTKRVLTVVLSALAGCTTYQTYSTAGGSPTPLGDAGAQTPPASAGDDAGANGDAGPGLGAGDAAPPAPRWEWANPTPTGANLSGVWAIAEDDVWLVGGEGTVLRWDGVRARDMSPPGVGGNLFSVWASADDDVWVLGDTNGQRLLHWDGASWSNAFLVNSIDVPLRSIWGADKSNVWLATGDAWGVPWWGGIEHWNGSTWEATNLGDPASCNGVCPGFEARDFWGSGASDVWAVGDSGVAHWDGAAWKILPRANPSGPADPFKDGNRYFGVWGAARTDVWAAFLNVGTGEEGVSHWDGTAWTVGWTDTPGGVYDPGPGGVGHRMWGTDADHIVAMLDDNYAWSRAPQAPRGWGRGVPGSFDVPPTAFGAAPGAHALLGSSAFGQLLRLDTSAPPGGAWQGVFPQYRGSLTHVSVARDGSVWATGDRVLRWSSGTWVDAGLVVGWTPRAVWANAANDVWVSGGALVVHWDGSSWSPAIAVPDGAAVWSFWSDGTATNVWATGNEGDPAYGSGALLHWDGAAWSIVARTDPSVAVGSLWGTGAADLWIAGDGVAHKGQIAYPGDTRVLRWDGYALAEVYRGTPALAPTYSPVWASSATDVWVGSHLHWDGAAWGRTQGDTDPCAIWGSGPHDVWMADYGTGPSEPGVIRHWDGSNLSIAFRTSLLGPPLSSLAGGAADDVWAVGEGGATIHFHTPSSATP